MPKSTLDELLHAPEAQIRVILRALCQDTQVRNSALDYLDSLKILYGSDSGVFGPDATTTTKRKADDEILICVQCDCSFYKNGNDKTSCEYHWGECEPDYESNYWADHDEGSHGPIDTKDNRKDCPEGFVWTCCDKNYTEDGCARGFHEADPRKSRRESGREPSDVDDDDDEDDLDEDEDEEDEDDEEPVFLSANKK
ncbi:uncharacterized protein FIESC28_03744 [Fusarium coffeatum]|uniref:C2H2-type domain-containing protein n=1 Tax=Fusarium coffeatum TaxID=231269 RepID=A0A366S3F9_9HYPO|nr:uncharacterized protein FIESC28_03744 [Fusarium coffeatum]RBR23562.1 hypothetical protein FIESC28_03744 [Fusarium coffeatum]